MLKIWETHCALVTRIKAIRSPAQDYIFTPPAPWISLMHPVAFLTLLSYLGLALGLSFLDLEVCGRHRVTPKLQNSSQTSGLS